MKIDMSVQRTCPQSQYLVLFDGHCAFCRSQAARLESWASNRTPVITRDFQAEGALDDLPNVTHDDCMKAMRLVTLSGVVYSGAEAVARLLTTRAWFGWLGYGYYVPGLRGLFDKLYESIARRRYALAKRRRTITCDGNTCSMHFE